MYLDDVESSTTEWSTESREGSTRWARVTNQALSGVSSWYIEETDTEEVDQILVSPSILITGINPVLRFWHRYEIVAGANGGFIEIRGNVHIKLTRSVIKIAKVNNAFDLNL